MKNNQGIKKLEERVVLYQGFINDKKVSLESYAPLIENTKVLIEIAKSGVITKDQFKLLQSRDRWDIYRCFSKSKWYCERCGNESKVQSPFIGSIHCGDCDYELSHRTNGGQSNPFRWMPEN